MVKKLKKATFGKVAFYDGKTSIAGAVSCRPVMVCPEPQSVTFSYIVQGKDR
jgi:hypothetical protein